MFKKKGASAGSGKLNLEEVMKIGSEVNHAGEPTNNNQQRMLEETPNHNEDDQPVQQVKEFKNEKKLLQSMTRGLGAKTLSLSMPETLGSVYDIKQQRNLGDYGEPDVPTQTQVISATSHLQKRQAGNQDNAYDNDGGDLVDKNTHRINADKLAQIEKLSRTIKEDAKNKAYWSVGMIEVDVGLERKIANIEATEALKREYLIQEFVKGMVANPSAKNGKISSTTERVDPIQNVAKWIFKPQGGNMSKKEREKRELHQLVKSFKHEGKGQHAGKVLGGLGIRLGQLPAKLLEDEDQDDFT